ncbi:MAG: 50S ribosomal protein L25 [Caldilineaceae bacterium]|jgi:large subunit ribosomal protein L25
MSELKISAQPREITRRKTRQLRREGLVPVVLYGPATAAQNLQVNGRAFDRLLHNGGSSQLVSVDLQGDLLNVLVREVQRDPVSHAYIHADFYVVDMSQQQQVSVNVHAVNEPESHMAGLMMYQAMDSVEISALPTAIPASIQVDVGGLTLENSITIADLPVLDGVTYLADPGETVFTMITTRVEEEEEEEELEEEMLEPEVVGREGDEDEEFEEEE